MPLVMSTRAPLINHFESTNSQHITRMKGVQNIPSTLLRPTSACLSANLVQLTGTRLRLSISRFSRYKLRSLKIHWLPTAPTTQQGTVYIGTMGYNDTVDSYEAALPSTLGGVITAVYRPVTSTIPVGTWFDRWRPISGVTEEEIPFYIIFHATGDVDFTADGIFLFEYDLDVCNPIAPGSNSPATQSIAFQSLTPIEVNGIENVLCAPTGLVESDTDTVAAKLMSDLTTVSFTEHADEGTETLMYAAILRKGAQTFFRRVIVGGIVYYALKTRAGYVSRATAISAILPLIVEDVD